jgi:hypothetical protein
VTNRIYIPSPYFTVFIFFFFPFLSFTQKPIYGIIKNDLNGEVLPSVTVRNAATKQINSSDLGGNFRINGKSGDTLLFSSVGYLTDTILVTDSMPGKHMVIMMRPKAEALPLLVVSEETKYKLDSLQRRQDYAYLLNKKHPVKLWNKKRPGDEPGLSFSPVGFFSKTEKQKRKLKARLKQEDEEEYIDIRFSQSRVAYLTRLKGDSLRLFMTRFRPSYAYCRKATDEDITLYTNEKLIQFKRRVKDPGKVK